MEYRVKSSDLIGADVSESDYNLLILEERCGMRDLLKLLERNAENFDDFFRPKMSFLGATLGNLHIPSIGGIKKQISKVNITEQRLCLVNKHQFYGRNVIFC